MQKKILVVEDDTKAAKALSLRLRSSGYDVLIANDGNEGLILAKSYAPDLVMTDIWMPVGMGFALAYRLREFARDLPILFVTGSRRPGVEQAVKNFGSARLMEKPYTPKELFAVVAEMLGEVTPAKLIQPRPLPRCKTEAPHNGDGKKILIVEDDRKIGISLSLRLKSAGYETLLAQDALMGLSMAVKSRPDLLILDISMPAGDGFQVAERVRALVPGHMPIIFLTASKQPSFRTKAAELGAAGFFEKPFKSDELLAAIEAALTEGAQIVESMRLPIAAGTL
jgi:DNA-binding response OmpR family regulator